MVATPKGDLIIRNADDGAKVATLKPGSVALEGLAAASGRLYVSTADGKLICMGSR